MVIDVGWANHKQKESIPENTDGNAGHIFNFGIVSDIGCILEIIGGIV